MLDRQDFLKSIGLIVAGSMVDTALPVKRITSNQKREILVPDMNGTSYWEMLMFSCLQGLANRNRARIFLYYNHKSTEGWYDKYPVPDKRYIYEWYKQYNHLNFNELVNPYDLFGVLRHSDSKHRDDGSLPLTGYVIVDTADPITANIAANYASTENLLPVTEGILTEYKNEMPSLKVKRDLRGRFRNMAELEVYEWAFKNQFPKANHSRVANLGTPTPAPPEELPLNTLFTSNRSRDYTVAERGFFFELASKGKEYDLKDRILQAMKPRGYVFGWEQGAGETRHISQLSKNGQLAIGAATRAANFSFHSRVKVPGAVQRFKKKARRPHTAGPLKNKIYLTFVLSDGDSLNVIVKRTQGGQWQLPGRGNIPFGWEMQPLLADLGPGLLDYFQATATDNDYFVDGVSGIGYFYPHKMPEDKLRGVLDETANYLHQTGESALTVMSVGSDGGVSDEIMQIYADILGDELTGVMEGYINRSAHKERLFNAESKRKNGSQISVRPQKNTMVWVPTALPLKSGQSVDAMVEYLRKLADNRLRRPLFIPIHVPAHRLTIADMVKVANSLDPDVFEIVGPNAFYTLFAKARAETFVLAPPEGGLTRTTLISGTTNEVTIPIQGFGDKQTVSIRYKLTSDFLSQAVAGKQSITLQGNNEIQQLAFNVQIPSADGVKEGTLIYMREDGVPLLENQAIFLPLGDRLPDSAITSDVVSYEAERGGHRLGRRAEDPEALNGVVWKGLPEKDVSLKHPAIVFYKSYEQGKGDYVAFFRMKVSDNASSKKVAVVDAVEYVPHEAPVPFTVLKGPSRKIQGTDFKEAGEYQWFAIPFSRPITDSPLRYSQMQYRVKYFGHTALSIDRITVVKLIK